MQGVRDYLKFTKRGYSRVTQMTALDIRNGRLTKEEAENLVNKWEGNKPPSLELFLEFMEMTEIEFNEIVSKLAVPPHTPDFKTIKWGPRTSDFNRWYREKKD